MTVERMEGLEMWRVDDRRADFIVEDAVLVEIKSVDHLVPLHDAQVLTYLKLTGLPRALLMNVNVPGLKAGVKSFMITRRAVGAPQHGQHGAALAARPTAAMGEVSIAWAVIGRSGSKRTKTSSAIGLPVSTPSMLSTVPNRCAPLHGR